MPRKALLPYRASLAGTLLIARESVMAPIRPILRRAGVTEQQWRVLRVLDDEGELDPSTLANRAVLHAPSVTRILKELLDRKLIDRLPDAKDGRRSLIRLTAGGRRLVQETAKETVVILDAFAKRFGESRVAALRNELAALEEALRSVGASTDPEP
ncbi:homoprotocatechuate degradation operon regulator HpaR [Phenylobacterium sp.]|uniref:homoprotocatechuate degradation operon regulator HpaR n=1 Tax=Phenylobacterium sp. TaxID=1871053 RepID=UPI002B45B27F|nr:homoprotocatechuate degradation operon regulator HpaR [Phenylobacterium sp.]